MSAHCLNFDFYNLCDEDEKSRELTCSYVTFQPVYFIPELEFLRFVFDKIIPAS